MLRSRPPEIEPAEPAIDDDAGARPVVPDDDVAAGVPAPAVVPPAPLELPGDYAMCVNMFGSPVAHSTP